MNNKNYRVMKFFEPVNKTDKSRGYVRLDMRGNKGNLIVAAENLGDAKSTSEVYLYKDKHNKIKLGDINNKKGLIKKMLTFGNNSAIEDYNVCAVVKEGKIVLYSNLFNTSSPDVVRKLEEKDVDIKELEKSSFPINEKHEVKHQREIINPIEKNDVNETINKEIEPKEIIETKELKETRVMKESEEIKGTEIKETKDIIEKDNKVLDKIIKEATVKEATVKEEVKDKQETSKQRFRNRFDENLYNTLKEYKTVEPLSVKLRNFNWWYIPYDEMGAKSGILPYYNQIISSYYPYPMSSRVTTCASLMKKYGHYIFGIYKENDEVVKFIYGVPGEFTKEEQPYKGVTGFKNWSYANKDNNKEDNGYWLAFVNPKTGETTDPPQIS